MKKRALIPALFLASACAFAQDLRPIVAFFEFTGSEGIEDSLKTEVYRLVVRRFVGITRRFQVHEADPLEYSFPEAGFPADSPGMTEKKIESLKSMGASYGILGDLSLEPEGISLALFIIDVHGGAVSGSYRQTYPTSAALKDGIGGFVDAFLGAQPTVFALRTDAEILSAPAPGSGGRPTSARPEGLPEFPLPAPRPSGKVTFERDLFVDPFFGRLTSLGMVETKLRKALDACGYSERSYYSVPGGFAVATRVERVEEDGSSAKAGRWDLSARPSGKFDLGAILRRLFVATPGRYRVIVFVVTTEPIVAGEGEATDAAIAAWTAGGGDRLPLGIAVRSFTDEHAVVALVYEIEKYVSRDTARVLVPGRFDGIEYLARAGWPTQLKAALKMEE